MKLDFVYKTLLVIDKGSDYVPVLSTLTNLVDLFRKYVFSKPKQGGFHEKKYNEYVYAKDSRRSLLLLVPILGNIVVALHDHCYTKEETLSGEEPLSGEETEPDSSSDCTPSISAFEPPKEKEPEDLAESLDTEPNDCSLDSVDSVDFFDCVESPSESVGFSVESLDFWFSDSGMRSSLENGNLLGDVLHSFLGKKTKGTKIDQKELTIELAQEGRAQILLEHLRLPDDWRGGAVRAALALLGVSESLSVKFPKVLKVFLERIENKPNGYALTFFSNPIVFSDRAFLTKIEWEEGQIGEKGQTSDYCTLFMEVVATPNDNFFVKPCLNTLGTVVKSFPVLGSSLVRLLHNFVWESVVAPQKNS